MHVILKPFIKIFIWIAIFFGIAEIAGIDVEELLSNIDLENFDLGSLFGGGDKPEEESTTV